MNVPSGPVGGGTPPSYIDAVDPSTYKQREVAKAVAWKQVTATLPDEARLPAAYVGKNSKASGPLRPVCLPPEHAALNLLPEVRSGALELFAELGIPWHAGVDGGPSNHLQSSQVQCVNALGQMVHDPHRLVRAFGPLLDTAEVIEIEPGRSPTFEFIGDDDLLNEAVHGKRTRGSHCTSVDAAFVHRTTAGQMELVLVEWKYTEAYAPCLPDAAKLDTRWARYGTLLQAADSPIDTTLLDFADLTVEPIYQLMRQQLLAHELERTHAFGADVVRVVHVRPAGNIAYQRSLDGMDAYVGLGDTVDEVWSTLLCRPDRFTTVDSAHFLNADITSDDYVARYGDDR